MAISFGLKHTQTLKDFTVSGNGIGQFGMRLLMQAMSTNQHTAYTIHMKNIDADFERKVSKNAENSAINFDPQNPEGKYSLNLEECYN